jgi:hypothetical protein
MKKIIIIIFLSFFTCIVYAEHYHWVEKGVHHFSNYQGPPDQKDEIVTVTNIKKSFVVTKKPRVKLEKSRSKLVKIYSSSEKEKAPEQKKSGVAVNLESTPLGQKDESLLVINTKAPSPLPQGHKKELYDYKQAAKKGDAIAQYTLGYMYLIGQGVPRDDEQAAYWYKKAAEQGEVSAQFNLGVMYSKGIGVIQNYKLAYVWDNLAAAQGHESAIREKKIIGKKLSPQQLIEAQNIETKIQHRINQSLESQNSESPWQNTKLPE